MSDLRANVSFVELFSPGCVNLIGVNICPCIEGDALALKNHAYLSKRKSLGITHVDIWCYATRTRYSQFQIRSLILYVLCVSIKVATVSSSLFCSKDLPPETVSVVLQK